MLATAVASGAEALAVLRTTAQGRQPFELVLLDLQMPVMDGFELTRLIKADVALRSVRLMLMTSFGQRGHGAQAHQLGLAAYLTKPVRQSQLYDCIVTVLSRDAGAPAIDIAIKGKAAKAATNLVTRHTLEEARVRPRGGRVLIAEDNIINQKIALQQTAKLGYYADVVANGAAALEALQRIQYDIILMDCQMPEMDGYAATREIRRGEAEASAAATKQLRHSAGDTLGRAPVRIIAMTANAMDGDREKCLAVGMDDYIMKPVRLGELAATLDRWMPGDDEQRTHSVEETIMEAERHADVLTVTKGQKLATVEAWREATEEDARPTAKLSVARLPPAAAAHVRDAITTEIPATIASTSIVEEGNDVEAMSETLRSLEAELGAKVVSDLVATFVPDTEQRLAILHTAVEAADTLAIRREAHTLKGSCGNMGAQRMAALCAQLEQHGRDDALTEAALLLPLLDSVFYAVKVKLADKEFLSSLQAQ